MAIQQMLLGSSGKNYYWYGERGVFMGVYTDPAFLDRIQYITIANTGNATDFGDLQSGLAFGAGFSGQGRVHMAGGYSPLTNMIQYVTAATLGNSTDVANLAQNTYSNAGCSSPTYGLSWNGESPSPATPGGIDNIQRYTIGTGSNAWAGPDSLISVTSRAACSDGSRGVAAGGATAASPYPYYNIIDYVTIDSLGNAQDFGDLINSPYQINGTGSTTYGVFAGGYQDGSGEKDEVQRITIQTTSNATDFCDLTQSQRGMGTAASETRGVFAGGNSPATNVIQYMTFTSSSNCSDFGDLLDSGSRYPTGAGSD